MSEPLSHAEPVMAPTPSMSAPQAWVADAAERSLPWPAPMQPLRVRAYTATCAAGEGVAALVRALHRPVSALQPHGAIGGALPGHVGPVAALAGARLPPALQAWDCRNNRLAWLALNQDGFLQAAQAAVARHGATRVAVLMGTSTSSIGASEEAYTRLTPQGQFPPDLARPEVHMLHSLGAFVAQALGALGPCMTVATACSSSAKVFAQAERLIRSGLVDAAVVGGVDSLCHSVLYGFQALGLVSARLCRPFDVARDGINLAEAGGFALLERPDAHSEASPAEVYLIGHGESSDAHHMSAPHPQGLGAMRAMQEALARACVKPCDVGYINLHGTGTPKNDAAEAAVVSTLFPPSTRVGSTKGWTGHTLGAAGILEAVICMLALQQGWTPGSLHTEQPDPALGEAFARMLQRDTVAADTEVAMSNSFGFGGNNCALLFARTLGGAGMSAPERAPASPQAHTVPSIDLAVQGIGLWLHDEGMGMDAPAQAADQSVYLSHWAQACAFWRGEAPLGSVSVASARPQARLLPPAERRRAPATVALALEVAEQACQMSGLAPQVMRSVFCSSLGDMAITDYLCTTLAESPEHLSPIKFHHSVHNAAAGYWTIAVCNMQACTAMAAGQHSFAQALLEAASQVVCEQVPVLLVAYDMPSPGPLAAITGSHALLGLALVLTPPDQAPAGTAVMSLSLQTGQSPPASTSQAVAPGLARLMARSPMGAALPLFEQLALMDAPGSTGRAQRDAARLKLSSGLEWQVGLGRTN